MGKNHFMERESIGKLMLKFSVPCIMSLLVSSLYNIVDQIFIGQGIGYLGNGATNVVFPVTIIALAMALMVGDGCAGGRYDLIHRCDCRNPVSFRTFKKR